MLKRFVFAVFAFLLVSWLFPGICFAENSFSFAVISDTHLVRKLEEYQNGWQKEYFEPFPSVLLAVDKIKKLKPDFVIHCGDAIHTSYSRSETPQDIKNMWDVFEKTVYLPLAADGIDLVISKGNHDVLKAAKDTCDKNLKKFSLKKIKVMDGAYPDHFCFEYGECLFVILNGSSVSYGDTQNAWLKSKIETGKKYNSVFFVSHLGLSGTKRHPNDCLRGESYDIMAAVPYDAILFSGHHHKYFEAAAGRIKNYSLATLGAFGSVSFLYVTVDGKNVKVEKVTV